MSISKSCLLSSVMLAALTALLSMACGRPSRGPTFGSGQSALVGASAPTLGAASSFAVLGASTVTCTNASSVTGDVGVSPGTAITGFNPDCTLTGTLQAGDPAAAQAQSDAAALYGALASTACLHNLTGLDLGGMTLAPGVYCFDSSAGLTGQLFLDGAGDANAVWIFQIASTLTTGTNASVVMAGNGQPCNVFWQIGSSATIGVGTAFQGNLVALASITLVSGTSLVGRALALNAAVTMDHNNVSGSCLGSGPAADAGSAADSGSGSCGDGEDDERGSDDGDRKGSEHHGHHRHGECGDHDDNHRDDDGLDRDHHEHHGDGQ